ncbi:hypothetical protein KJ708_07570 [bacterium]|nr:hypothetical protein [bacterium]MBU1919015.1 hypothetical protein [bacterium]
MILKLFIIILISYFLIKFIYKQDKKRFKRNAVQSNNSQQIEELLSCPVCTTFFQKDQGIKKKNRVFCSEDCASK